MTTSEFILKAKIVHGDKYDYSKIEYKTTKIKVCIICPIHGEFWQTPEKHLKGQGCPKCRYIKSGKIILNTDDFIRESNKIHDCVYDYSKTEYVNNSVKVCIICPEHGEFWQSPNHHLKGQGCPKCRYIKSAKSNMLNGEEAINLLRNTHGNKYDYSLTEYKGYKKKIRVICHDKDEYGNEHGEFSLIYANHLNGQGCPVCARKSTIESNTYTTDDFKRIATKVHDGKYCYDKVEYINSISPVDIICPVHGTFSQIARNHLQGQGCKLCFKEKSNIEREMSDFIRQYFDIIENDRTILNGRELDVYIPSKKIAFEVDGLIWHSEKFKQDKNYHLNKTIECNKKGIKLIHVFEDEWLNKRNIVQSRIENILGVSKNRVFARKCKVQEISYQDSKEFLERNHCQGNCISRYRYGLFDTNNELISVMTFGHLRKNLNQSKQDACYELLRFCNKIGYSIVGGASKLLKHFINEIKPSQIISYADRRWSDGNLYEQLGFNKVRETVPSYFYVNNKERINRFNLRKDVLVSKYGCPLSMSEHDFCLSKQLYRIYDCGCLVFKMVLKDEN